MHAKNGATTFRIMTFSTMTLSTTTLSKTTHSITISYNVLDLVSEKTRFQNKSKFITEDYFVQHMNITIK